ncbi:hypothetical protein [Mesorhizobium sp. B1-1-8]|uniref:hypothetical protein n=1 Tax=Mesorhizobium sp. B1-1-8 TaxID=2589976 RepID=UPI00299F884A|nr:hypothetical protein [Mesorhizobium sp. B1-1-8]
MIEFYRTRVADDAHAVVGRETVEAVDREAAIEIARILANTLNMPQWPDAVAIADDEGATIYCGVIARAGGHRQRADIMNAGNHATDAARCMGSSGRGKSRRCAGRRLPQRGGRSFLDRLSRLHGHERRFHDPAQPCGSDPKHAVPQIRFFIEAEALARSVLPWAERKRRDGLSFGIRRLTDLHPGPWPEKCMPAIAATPVTLTAADFRKPYPEAIKAG